MAVQVLQFRPRLPRSSDWTQQEIAEFYRVESALLQAGLKLETERGVTDEGDPWFVFCREDTGEVFVHFARIDGQYIIDGAAYGEVARGMNFAALVREMMGSEVLALAKPRPKSSNVFLHPAALLIALVGAAFFHSGEAKAAEAVTDHHRMPEARRQGGVILISGSTAEKLPLGLDSTQQAAVMAGVIIGLQQQWGVSLTATVSLAAHETAPAPTLDGPPPALDLQASPATTNHLSADAAAAGLAAAADASTTAQAMHVSVALGALSFAQAPDAVSPISISLAFVAPPSAAAPAQPVIAFAPVVFQAPEAVQHMAAVLPNDDAGAFVQALTTAGHEAVVANVLPTLIAQAIGEGQHVSAAPPPAAGSDQPPPPAQTDTPAPSIPPSSDGGAAPPSTSGATPTPVAPAPVQATDTTPPAAPAPTTHVHDRAIDLVVSDFMTNVQHYQVMISGQNLVIYDGDIFGKLPVGTLLDSVTFTFSDGSSVSLVGTAAELVEAHHMH